MAHGPKHPSQVILRKICREKECVQRIVKAKRFSREDMATYREALTRLNLIVELLQESEGLSTDRNMDEEIERELRDVMELINRRANRFRWIHSKEKPQNLLEACDRAEVAGQFFRA